MRLVALSPRWWAEDGRQGQGVSFICPHCLSAGVARPTRLAVAFENPLDDGSPPDARTRLWRRAGQEFDMLTIRPSIDATQIGHGHWLVTDGGVRHA